MVNALPTLDPHVSTGFDREMTRAMHEPLVDLKRESFEIEPVLAESWQVSNEGKTYTFKLKAGVTFSDGTPFDANAVKANFDRITALKKGPYALVANVTGVEVVDPNTVRINIQKAFRPFLGVLRFVFMVSPKAMKEQVDADDLAQKWLHKNSAGTGPYMIQNWAGTTGATATLTRNDRYRGGWQGNHLETINLLTVPEPDTQRLMLERGDLDAAELINHDAFPALKANPSIQVLEKPAFSYMYVALQTASGPTTDPRVRKAFSYAFDYDAYNKLMDGSAPRMLATVPPELLGKGFQPTPIPQNTYDLDKAKALFKEAGVADGTSFGYYYTANEQRRLIGEVMQAGLQKAGMKLSVNAVTLSALFATPQGWGATKNPAEAWTAVSFTTPARIPDAWSYLWYMWHSKAIGVGSGRNLGYYVNPEFDALVDQAEITSEDDKVYDLYRKASQIVANDAPSMFLDTGYRYVTMRKNVTGFWFHSADNFTYPWYDMSKS
jgi:ABC-type transport system substrate-binding protein